MGIPGKKSQITLKITEEGLLLKQVAGGLTFIWTFILKKKYRSECFDITAWISQIGLLVAIKRRAYQSFLKNNTYLQLFFSFRRGPRGH